MPYDWYTPTADDQRRSSLDPEPFDYNIEMGSLFYRQSDGTVTELPKQMGQAAYNPDTGEVYKVHGGNYVPTPHTKVMNDINDVLKDVGFNLDNLEVNNVVGHNSQGVKGSRIRRDIIFHNEIIKPSVNDTMAFKISVLGSYDGSWAHQIVFSAQRLECLNGMVSDRALYRSYMKHTQTINMKPTVGRITQALEYFKEDEARFASWSKPAGPNLRWDAKVNSFIKSFSASPKPDDQAAINNDTFDNLLNRYDNQHYTMPHSPWRMYNALTDWSTHFEMKRKNSPDYNERLKREQKVSSALRSSEWNSLVAA